ncbi:MAG TPA: tetratricopeptide repeat protein [Verrucomicrobiae bacterium]|nr:tetratricopeptide repeat protein [Verrucomicrobiae bacterium]
MKNLPHPDDKHLEAVEGWLGLGNWREAEAELKNIDPGHRLHPFVLEMRYKIYEQSKDWQQAAVVAENLRELLPENQWGHFYLAYSLHELKRTQEAYDTLASVIPRFPEHHLMRYNLACYACQLGKLDESLTWLKKAIKLANDKEIRAMALTDPDLKPLWPQIKKL